MGTIGAAKKGKQFYYILYTDHSVFKKMGTIFITVDGIFLFKVNSNVKFVSDHDSLFISESCQGLRVP